MKGSMWCCSLALAMAAGLVLSTTGCGGEPPAAREPSDLKLKNVASQSAPTDEVPEADDPEPVAEPEPAASADEPAPTAEPKPAPPPSSGRPAILMGPLKSISTTFGTTPGAVLKLSAKGGTITLKIPEGALYAGTNIIFKVAGGKAKKKPKVLGTVVYLEPILGGKRWSKGIKSDGPAFEFRMPLVGKDSVNLAVGAFEITSDGTGGEVTWTVHAPTRVESGFGEAYFHLPSIHPSYIYATTDEPTAP